MSAEGFTRTAIDGSRPPDAGLVATLETALDTVETDGTPLVLDVGGAPGRGWADDLEIGMITKWERTVRRLERVPAVTVSVAAGDVGGTALDALLATDLRVATPDTRLLPAPDDAATWPGMAAYRMAQQAGAGAVRQAVIFGVPVDAGRALELGLVHQVEPRPGEVPERFQRLARGVVGRELAVRRRILLDATTTGFEEALGAHLAACDRQLRLGRAPDRAANGSGARR